MTAPNQRILALGAIVTLALGACTGDDQSTSGNDLAFVEEEGVRFLKIDERSTVNDAVGWRLALSIDESGCLLVMDLDSQKSYLAVLPRSATFDGESVHLTSSSEVRLGDEFVAGRLAVGDVGDALSALLENCSTTMGYFGVGP